MFNDNNSLCFSAIVVFTFLFGFSDSVEQCRTPDGYVGACKLLKQCPPLNDINNKFDKSDDDLLFLRQSTCGVMTTRPKVCCPHESEWNRRIYTPYPYSTTERFEEPEVKPHEAGLDSRLLNGTPKTNTSAGIRATPSPAPLGIPDSTAPPGVRPGLQKPRPFGPGRGRGPSCPSTLGPPSEKCCGIDSSIANKITGGQAAEIDQFPWLALLEYAGGRLACGGTLISSRYVMTAAHCVVDKRFGRPEKVRLSEYNTTSFPVDTVETNGGGLENITVEVVTIERYVVHPNYNGNTLENDIALLKLSSNTDYTDFIRPICLPNKDPATVLTPKSKMYVAGWGSDGKYYSEIKLQVSLPYVPMEQCQQAHKRTLFETQICAGGEDGKDSCTGDSGGPLMYEENRRFKLAGVISFGPKHCGSLGKPSVNTHVYKYLDWILSEMI